MVSFSIILFPTFTAETELFMQTAPPTVIKTQLILHMGFFMGQFIFALIALALVATKVMAPPIIEEYHGEIILSLALLATIAFLLSRFLYKRKVKKINQSNGPLAQQIELLRGANMVRWVILEAVNLLSIVLFVLTNAYDIYILIVALLIVFFLSRPTAMNIATDLNVRDADILNLP